MPSGFLARHPRKIAALAVVALFVLGGLGYLLATGTHPADVFAKLKDLAQWCAKANPAFYVIGLAILPYCGVPSSFIYLAAGGVYGFKMGLFWSALGLSLNLSLGYVIGTRWLRAPIAGWLERRGRRLPEVPPGEFGKLVVLTRIIPGPPLVAQNFLLALAGVPFPKYFLLSLPLSLLFAAGVLMTSGALVEGNTKLVVLGVCLVVALGLLAHVVNAMYKAKQQK